MLFLFVRFLHIASAMWFIGGILARQIVRAYAKRTDDVQRFATLSTVPTKFCHGGNLAG
jgi:uncharacterized protein with PQ loop repeat